MRKTIPIISLIILLCVGCERSEYCTQITGTAYTDSTLTTPIANDTLWFYNYIWGASSKCLGCTSTDSHGRFGFLFWNVDIDRWDPHYESKFQFEEPRFIITYKEDTLFMGNQPGNYINFIIYPQKTIEK